MLFGLAVGLVPTLPCARAVAWAEGVAGTPEGEASLATTGGGADPEATGGDVGTGPASAADDPATESRPVVVTLSKVADDGSYLAGATIELRDPAGAPLRTIVTDGTGPVDLSAAVESGHCYVLHEVEAPAGYALAADVGFSVGEGAAGSAGDLGSSEGVEAGAFPDKSGEGVLMLDERFEGLAISKRTPEGEALVGAQLALVDVTRNEVVCSWTSGEAAYEVAPGLLFAGHAYRLEEASAPEGYEVAEAVTFSLDAQGEVTALAGDAATYDEDGRALVLTDEREGSDDPADSTDPEDPTDPDGPDDPDTPEDDTDPADPEVSPATPSVPEEPEPATTEPATPTPAVPATPDAETPGVPVEPASTTDVLPSADATPEPVAASATVPSQPSPATASTASSPEGASLPQTGVAASPVAIALVAAAGTALVLAGLVARCHPSPRLGARPTCAAHQQPRRARRGLTERQG